MATNKIEIYQNNSRTIGCYIYGGLDLSSFTPYLTVKRSISDASPIIEKIGMVTDPSTTVTFDLTPADTSLAFGDYPYDITIENETNIYTVVKDILSIINGVKY